MIIIVVVAVSVLIVSALILVGLWQYRQSYKKTTSWGTPSSLLTYDSLIVNKQAKRSVLTRLFEVYIYPIMAYMGARVCVLFI